MRHLVRFILLSGSVVLGLAVSTPQGEARPVTTHEGVLPQGTELNDEANDIPNEIFYSELSGGQRSDMSLLGDMLFNSSAIFGGAARQAGLSCGTCHQQGHNNAKLFIPGLSTKPGTYDGTNAVFSAGIDNHVLDAVTPPSLRGARDLWPYTHNGRFGTLQDFVRHAIVNEFGGEEPSRKVVDAITAYVQDIAFLPNDNVGAAGKLTSKASVAAQRGEKIFNRPFRRDAALSCAACHQPSGQFVDHRLHDVGSDGAFKTPTLMNANFNGPYFHDGRYATYGEVVAHFDRVFDLGLSAADKNDLVAYLNAVGDGKEPMLRRSVTSELQEIDSFVPVLAKAVTAHDRDIIHLAVDGIGNEWREVGERFPEKSIPGIAGGERERLRAAKAARAVVLTLRAVDMAASEGKFEEAAQLLADYKNTSEKVAAILREAEPWSLFNPNVQSAQVAALNDLAGKTR